MKSTQASAWRLVQRQNFTQWGALADFLQLTADQRVHIIDDRNFPLNLPLRLAQKIDKQTLDDPILRQFLPVKAEQALKVGFSNDPVGEQQAQSEVTKLLHKYTGRALLVTTQACAMHCRYCFRRHFNYQSDRVFVKELAAIQADPSLHEILLSGGDPLSLETAFLGKILHSLAQIEHVQRIRFHTRFPIGIPERIDADFLAMLAETKKQIWFVIHCNHPAELDQDVLCALKQVQKLGIPVLNQSVLLKDVNDDPIILKNLSEKLINHGIMPYYLHQLDRVQGAAHFEVAEATGKQLINHLQSCLPGYAVPKYAREIAGLTSKTLIC